MLCPHNTAVHNQERMCSDAPRCYAGCAASRVHTGTLEPCPPSSAAARGLCGSTARAPMRYIWRVPNTYQRCCKFDTARGVGPPVTGSPPAPKVQSHAPALAINKYI